VKIAYNLTASILGISSKREDILLSHSKTHSRSFRLIRNERYRINNQELFTTLSKEYAADFFLRTIVRNFYDC